MGSVADSVATNVQIIVIIQSLAAGTDCNRFYGDVWIIDRLTDYWNILLLVGKDYLCIV